MKNININVQTYRYLAFKGSFCGVHMLDMTTKMIRPVGEEVTYNKTNFKVHARHIKQFFFQETQKQNNVAIKSIVNC